MHFDVLDPARLRSLYANKMKAKGSNIIISLSAVTFLFAAYGLGYHRGCMAGGPVVHYERDRADTPDQGSAKVWYEADRTKVNSIPSEAK